jgi:hypothetical protein
VITGPNKRIYYHLYQHEIAEAGDEGQRRYEDETPAGKRTAAGLEKAINTAINLKKQKLNAPFTKYLIIANPSNGSEFLEEVLPSIHALHPCSPGTYA